MKLLPTASNYRDVGAGRTPKHARCMSASRLGVSSDAGSLARGRDRCGWIEASRDAAAALLGCPIFIGAMHANQSMKVPALETKTCELA